MRLIFQPLQQPKYRWGGGGGSGGKPQNKQNRVTWALLFSGYCIIAKITAKCPCLCHLPQRRRENNKKKRKQKRALRILFNFCLTRNNDHFITSYDIHMEVLFHPINSSSLHGKQKQSKASCCQKYKSNTEASLCTHSNLQHFGHCLQERGLAAERAKDNTACTSPSATISITSSILPPWRLSAAPWRSSSSVHGAFREPPSAALHPREQRPDRRTCLFKTGWSPCPARARGWRHHWICFCMRPLVPRARCAVLNQTGQLAVCHPNFLTWV